MYALLIALIFISALLTALWVVGAWRILSFTFKANPSVDIAVSVIVCARNEVDNLKEHLPVILEQDYENYELLVVNDHSRDGTEELLNELSLKHEKLRVLHLRDGKLKAGKKQALAAGIKNAKHEAVLLTDADCKPLNNGWVRAGASALSNNEVCLGIGLYKHQKGLVNQLVQWDTFFTAFQYIWYALAGKPYMGVGRNMGYHKSLFLNKKPQKHDELPGGDDDLFIINLRKRKTVVMNTGTYATLSEAQREFGKWMNQKTRHLSTSFYYPLGLNLTLFLLTSISFLFYPLALFLVFYFPQKVFIAVLFKLLVQYVAVKKVGYKWGFKPIKMHFIWAEPLLMALFGVFHLRNIFKTKPHSW